MAALRQEIIDALGRLQPRPRTAFAAACAEHVLPIYEALEGRDSLRRALRLAWRFALGEEVTKDDIRWADEAARDDIPHIDQEETEEANLAMTAGVVVLETLASISDPSPQAAFRAIAGALDAIAIACRLRDPEAIDYFRPFEDPEAEDVWPEQCAREWALQQAMLEDLLQNPSASAIRQWPERHRQRGEEVAHWWRS